MKYGLLAGLLREHGRRLSATPRLFPRAEIYLKAIGTSRASPSGGSSYLLSHHCSERIPMSTATRCLARDLHCLR
jgi:hypothetical protein